MWSVEDGYPTQAFLTAVHPDLGDAAKKMSGRHVAPGDPAGTICAVAAKKLGLIPGTPVSAAIIDAHAGVPGTGAAEEGTLVMVMGTSSCHMLNSRRRVDIPGVAGVVKDGILPGFYGYETGQAAVGDAFDWCRQLLKHRDFSRLSQLADEVPAGSEGVLCLDWMNGCRTPLMDGSLSGAFTGLKLHHTAGHMYRALMESSAFGFRWIVELFESNGIPIQRLLATGGLPNHNPGLMQIYADVVNRPIEVSSTEQGPAVGAAILGALAAGAERSGFQHANEAIRRMAKSSNKTYKPRKKNLAAYDQSYAAYRALVELHANSN